MDTDFKSHKYMQLIQFIKSEIQSGRFKRGDRIYTEEVMCKMFDISRQTVRQAISILIEEGFLESRRGSGTYVIKTVSSHPTTHSIGVISSNMNEYIFPTQVSGIEHVLAKNGYSMQILLTHDTFELEANVLKTLTDKSVDGLLFEPTKSALPSLNIHYYEALRDLNIPMIMINAYSKELDFPYIGLDDRSGGRLAAEYLVSKGHTSIAGIFKLDDYQGHMRYLGFMDIMQKYNIMSNEKNVVWYSTENFNSLCSGFQDSCVLQCIADCTAVFCYNDQMACNLIQLFRRNGLSVPDDISVIGYDDSSLASVNTPTLTTIKHPGRDLGVVAAENLLRLIEDPSFNASHQFKPELIERESVKKKI